MSTTPEEQREQKAKDGDRRSAEQYWMKHLSWMKHLGAGGS